MDYNKMFNDFIKNSGYDFSGFTDNNSNNDEEESTPPGVADEACRCGNSDIPGGFQDLNPMLFVVIGEIIGNIIASQTPFNVQNALGNWLQLVGQAIETYNAQQQYFQGGPGRYYNPIYRNSGNPFCPNTTDESGANTSGNPSSMSSNTSNSNSTDEESSTSSKANKKLQNRIDKLERDICELKKMIDILKEN